MLTATLTDRKGYFKLRLSKKESEIALTVSKELYRDITLVLLPSTVVLPGNKNDEYASEEDLGKVERTTISKLFISSKQRIQSLNLSGFFTNSPFQASLTPGLGTHGIFNSQVVNKFSLNLAGGYTTGVKGLELAGGFNINKGDVSYVQVAGIFNIVGGSVKGVQLAGVNNTILDSVKGVEVAGVYNDVRGDFLGVQLGGAANVNKKDIKYVQIAGALNRVGGTLEGVQISGAVNMVKDSVTGIQITGMLNEAKGTLLGVQISGAFNRVRKEMTGLQLSGAVNIANKEFNGLQLTSIGNISNAQVNGVQVSSVFNYAKKLHGVQLGIVNLADSSSGVSIGLLNLIKDGYHKVSISYNEVMNTNFAFKSGNAKLYTIYLGGINISDKKKAYSCGLGFGHDFILGKKLLVSAEASSSVLYVGNWDQLDYLSRVKTALNFELVKGLSIFAGPAINVYFDNNPDRIEGYKNITPSDPLSFNYSKTAKGWLGFEAGITLF